MPLDPTIILGGRAPAPIQTPSPLDLLLTVERVQGLREQTELRRLAGEKARQAAADDAAIRRVLTETNGDIEAALPKLRAIAPQASVALEEGMHKARKENYAALNNEMDYKGKQLTHGLNLLAGMNDTPGYRAGRPMIAAMSPELDKFLPPEYDPETTPALLNQLNTIALSAKERLDLQQQGFKQLLGDKPIDGLSKLYKSTQNDEQLAKVTQGAKAVGTPQALIDQFVPPGTTWSPEFVTRAASLGISSEKAAELTGAEAARTQTERHQTTQEDLTRAGQAQTAVAQAASQAIARGQLDVSRGQLGVAQAREQREAATPRGVKASEGERKAAGFHGQMQQALTTINALESKLTAADLYQIQSLPQEGITGAINRGAMSDNAKRYIQAFNQFTEARLRPVSGAAIAASEYERDRATYGKQYAETKDLAEQRQAARTQALEALRTMAGSALEEKPPPGGAATTSGGGAALTYQDYLRSKGGR